jgi:hypothetical protein
VPRQLLNALYVAGAPTEAMSDLGMIYAPVSPLQDPALDGPQYAGGWCGGMMRQPGVVHHAPHGPCAATEAVSDLGLTDTVVHKSEDAPFQGPQLLVVGHW